MTLLDQLVSRRDELARLAERHHASNLRVFGSVARGEEREDSDVDLLVDFGSEASLLDQVGLQADFERVLGRRVDIVTPNGVSPFLRERIVREARPI
ncbi:MAG: nucleotidyltransferase family protein [Azoarcus sp.]|nr:nucleotidyltransferase family protein [Azoarcus sp.]